MSARTDCGKHNHHGRKKIYKWLFYSLLAFVVLVLLVVLVIWLVLRPTKPAFSLQDATIYQLNATSGNTLSTSLQVSLSSRNPNDHIGIYYDRLSAYASYHDQQITLPSSLSPTYQGQNDISLWSSVLYGTNTPVAPFVAGALAQDQAAGFVVVTIKVDGELRWKVGTWVSGHYQVHVSCQAYVAYDSNGGYGAQPSLKIPQAVGCSTEV